MVAAQRAKASDKQDICKKILVLLKKAYPPPHDVERPVLETMLYAICIENASLQQAEESYERLFKSFHDLNEVRVSSMDELEAIFLHQPDADWRALRIRSVLQYIFEANYSFDFEALKRKTVELATKQLAKIKPLTPFIREYVLNHSLSSHILPLDNRMHAALLWLDLATAESTPEHTSETLRACVRKADGPEFCHYLRCLATDAKYRAIFQDAGSGDDDQPAPWTRLEQLLKGEHVATSKAKKGTSKKEAVPAPSETPSPASKEHQSTKEQAAKKLPRKPVAEVPVKSVKPKPAEKKAETTASAKHVEKTDKADKKGKKAAARSSQ